MDSTRRKFLLSLGGATAAISGWLLLPDLVLAGEACGSGTGHRPRLSETSSVRRMQRGAELFRLRNDGERVAVGVVNDWGRRVIEALDGHRGVSELASRLRADGSSGDDQRTEAAVAEFLAHLSRAGILAEPFFVNIHIAQMEG